TVRAEEKEVSKKEIKALIEKLVSPNDEPTTRAATYKFPADYDYKAQEDIFRTFNQLKGIGPPAFPQLFKNLDDKRYAYSSQGISTSHMNWSVGDLCRGIIRSYLQSYSGGSFTAGRGDPFARPRRPDYLEHYDL